MADILAEGDFLSRDIRYHTSCHLMHWQRYVQQPQSSNKDQQSDEETVAYVLAEIEFIDELKQRLDQGDMITVTEVAALYSNMMHDHGIHNKKITRQVLLEKIQQNLTNFTITDARGRKPSVLHSNEAGRSVIDQAIETLKER